MKFHKEIVSLIFVILIKPSRSQICFGNFIPPGNQFGGHCSYPLGGSEAGAGIYIPSFEYCCRRPGAAAWGYQYKCNPCQVIRGSLSSWSLWTACSKTCGAGKQSRRRVCSSGVCVGVTSNDMFQSRPCSWRKCCPVDGGWTQWSESTQCSMSCGHGYEYRIRSCSAPKTKCGGRNCVGSGQQYKECFTNCASWGEWIVQVPCSVTCGNGTQYRQRVCNRPLGGFCEGDSQSTISCFTGNCPRNGNWCKWMTWTSCSSSCSEERGKRRRVRICSCPFPENNGKMCKGDDRGVEECAGKSLCRVDGKWSDWNTWSSCSADHCSTRKGTRIRERQCTNLSFGGKPCEGSQNQTETCLNMQDCQIEGMYLTWSSWSSCSPTCGKCLNKKRKRDCISPFSEPSTSQVDVIIGTPSIVCKKKRTEQKRKCKKSCETEEPCNTKSKKKRKKRRKN